MKKTIAALVAAAALLVWGAGTTSPPPVRPALVQTDVPAELAQTGSSSTTPLLMLAGALLAAGVALVLARRVRKH